MRKSETELSMNRGEPVAYIWRNPFRVVKTRRFQPRVASVLAGLANTRQPWALRRNPFGILGLRRFMGLKSENSFRGKLSPSAHFAAGRLHSNITGLSNPSPIHEMW